MTDSVFSLNQICLESVNEPIKIADGESQIDFIDSLEDVDLNCDESY